MVAASPYPLHGEGWGEVINQAAKTATMKVHYIHKETHLLNSHWAQKPKNPV